MNYQDYIKYDPVNKQYTDSYGYVIDGVSSKALPAELTTAGEALAVANAASTSASAALAATTSGNFQTVTAGFGNANQLAITTASGVATITPTGIDSVIAVYINPKGGDGRLQVGANYSKSVSIVSNSAAKVTTFYSIDASVNLTLECKGASGKIIFTNNTNGTQYERLEMVQDNGSTTCTAATTQPGAYPNGDIKFVPRGLGIVDCKSYTMEWNRDPANGQTLTTGDQKVWFDNLIYSNFPANFITYADIGGGKYDTFVNSSGRAIAIMISGHVRETVTQSGRTISLWIQRDSSIRYGQMLLPSNGADHNDLRALNSTSILRLGINETFSLWVSVSNTGVTIGGASVLEARPGLSFRLMP